jgi:alpha-tubulin suppressor-like RCC1 family protein
MKRAALLLAVSVAAVAAAPRAASSATVAAGYSHTAVIKTSDGSLWTWGANSFGQLGDSSTTQRKTPVQAGTLTGVVAVAAGANHTLALKSDGTVWAFGYNLYGQLGDGTSGAGANKNAPVQVTATDFNNIIAIAAGDNHSLALKNDGSVWTWGFNGQGQLATGGTTNRSVPAAVSGLSGVIAIGAGGNHTLVVTNEFNNPMKAWGQNSNGQVGDGTTSQALNPVSVSIVTNASATAGGNAHTVTRKSDGTVLAWGYNFYGQLGDNSTNQRTTAVSVSGLSGVTSVAAGFHHSLAAKSDGSVAAWGRNQSDQIGDGTSGTNRLLPTPVNNVSGIVAVGAGQYHSVAVSSDGVVWAWGDNASGQIGDGTTTNRLDPVKISEAGFSWKAGTPTFSPAAGTYNSNQSVTISSYTSGATIRYTTDGTDPTGSSPVYSTPVSITATTTLKATASKAGLSDSNVGVSVYTMKVALPSFSPAGGTYTAAQNVTISTTTSGATLRYTTDGSEPTSSSTAYSAPVLVDTTTTLKAKGFKSGWTESDTRSGTYTMNFGTLAAPGMTPGAGTYISSVDVSMSAAPYATIRYTTNGSEPTSGSTIYTGPVTLTTTTTLKAKAFHPDYTTSATTTTAYTIKAATPTFTPDAGSYGASQTITIATATPGATITYTLNGADPTVTDPAIASGGSIVVGNYTLKARAFKTGCTDSDVKAASYTTTGAFTAAAVAGGGSHSLVLKTDGTVWGFGLNSNGQIGDTTTTSPRSTPVQVAGLTGVTAIAAGSAHSVALKSDGSVVAWGVNSSGQLGNGTTTQRTSPTTVPGLTGVVAIAAGLNHTVALKSDGSVVAWGENANGQLGDSTDTDRTGPVGVSGLTSGVVAIAAGHYHTLAVKSDGSVVAWGNNANGQVGDGSQTTAWVPTQVSGLTSGVAEVAAGGFHSLARKADGSVVGWGLNNFGQLGDGSTTQRLTPVSLTTLSSVSAVRAGQNHSYALKSNSTVWSWGNGSSGQLGDGTNVAKSTPVQVTGLPAIEAVDAGDNHGLAVGADKSVWAWGANGSSQLGDGTTTNRWSPVKVADADFLWKAGTPVFSPAPGSYSAAQTVTITSATPGATIRYTLDGTDPTTGSATYSSPLSIGVTTTLKARAWKSGLGDSNVAAGVYTLGVVTPTLSPGGATYSTVQTVTVSCATTGATIRYTTSGAEPTESDPIVTSGSTLAVDQSQTLKAKAWKTGWTPSATASATYTLKVATVTFSPVGGVYTSAQGVMLSTTSPGVTIRYTTNGLEPIETDPGIASGGTVYVSTSKTLKAKGYRAGWVPSDTASATYVLGLGSVATPTFSPAAGTYTQAQTVTIATTTAGAIIRYTLDGSDPTTVSPIFAAPLEVAATMTVKARAYKSEMSPSAVASAAYTIDTGAVAAPTITPGAGLYTTQQTVTISTATGGATIHYTTTGADPTESDATITSGGTLTVDRAMVLKAKAWKSGMTASAVTRRDYLVSGAVAAGGYHSLALKSNQTVWAWGAGSSGQLGDGTGAQSLTPVQVSSLTTATAIAAGLNHSMALKADGTVVAWGSNGNGQIGDGTSGTNRLSPVAVSGVGSAVAIAAGTNHSLALKSDGPSWRGEATPAARSAMAPRTTTA